MAFPINPVDQQTFTNPLGTAYKYDSTRTAWLIMSQVILGSQGDTGIQGVTGVLGIDGQTGIQGVTGILGIDGQTGIMGVDGVTGIQGVTGILGIDGQTGITGNTGIQGITGLGDTGIQGVTGFLGQTGIEGLSGVTGVVGTTGVSSKTGVLNFSMASNIGALYTGIMGQAVLPNNSYFTNWTVLSDVSSSINIDFQKSAYATYPTMASFHGSTGMFLNNTLKNTGVTNYWGTPTGAQGDIVRAVLAGTDGTAGRINLALNYNIY